MNTAIPLALIATPLAAYAAFVIYITRPRDTYRGRHRALKH